MQDGPPRQTFKDISIARDDGRPLATLILSDEQRSISEGLVRRHRMARSMSDHRRMILRCTSELGNKAVAVAVEVDEHAIGTGIGASSRSASTDCVTSPVRDVCAPSTINEYQVAEAIEFGSPASRVLGHHRSPDYCDGESPNVSGDQPSLRSPPTIPRRASVFRSNGPP